jgi:hypothetical protein
LSFLQSFFQFELYVLFGRSFFFSSFFGSKPFASSRKD